MAKSSQQAQSEISELRDRFRIDLDASTSPEDLRALRSRYLGKAGHIKQLRASLKEMAPSDRSEVAPLVEGAMADLEAQIEARQLDHEHERLTAREEDEWIDISLPGHDLGSGSLHPVTKLEQRCLEMLWAFGFETGDGPEVENAFYNFDALNVPPDHPARDLQDTFWLENELLLRSHTTSIQARALEERPVLPLKVVARGRVYRNEAVDATHLAMFHQLEGFWVDEGITFAHMKHVLASLVRGLFGDRRFRFKPKFYPYTEPSIGLDIACGNCDGAGCASCHDVGWVTVIGAGMVHPKVLRQFGYDPERVSGFAFGWGTTRLAYQWLSLEKVKDLYSVNLDDLTYYDQVANRSDAIG